MSDLISREAAIGAALYACSRDVAEYVEEAIRTLPAAPAAKVKPLEWSKSHIKPWCEDWHTTSSGYTIRCADEWGWKWSNSIGGRGHERSPEAAKAAAQADYESRILAAIEGAQ